MIPGVQMMQNVNSTLTKEVKVLFYKVFPISESVGYWNVPRLRPLVHLVRATYRKK
jgi:hypothetical protein